MNFKSLAGIFLLLAFPIVGQAEDYTYTTNNGTITITSYTGAGGAVTIPAEIDGLLVTSIGSNTFANCTSLTSVTIPASITNIAWRAFISCRNMTNAIISNGVISIEKEAFNGCLSLTSIYVPQSVIEIEHTAFAECYNLTEIVIATSNLIYSSLDGVFFNKDRTILFLCPGGKDGDYTIPSSVMQIEEFAFRRSPNIAKITIPASVVEIGDRAFNSCTKLTSITVDNLNPTYSSFDGVLFNKTQSVLITFPAGKQTDSYTVPQSVTSLDIYAFNKSPLVEVILPEGLIDIGRRAFWDCRNLSTITIPSSVTTIEANAFQWCSGLGTMYFEGNAPSLGTAVFDGATNVTVYYLSGTTGWTNPWADRPAVLWNPQIQTDVTGFGMSTNGFGFTIAGTNNYSVLVEACTNLTSGIWGPLQTGSISNGSLSFSDPQSTNYPSRFYRLRMP